MAMPEGSDEDAYIEKLEEMKRFVESLLEDASGDFNDMELDEHLNGVIDAIDTVASYLKGE